MDLNIDLHVHFVPGPDNPADALSHCLLSSGLKVKPSYVEFGSKFVWWHPGTLHLSHGAILNIQSDLAGYPLPFLNLENKIFQVVGMNGIHSILRSFLRSFASC